MLVIDHTNGGGNVHRRTVRVEAPHIYRWLRDQGYPDTFQTLCWNCNYAKDHGGCPPDAGHRLYSTSY